MGKYSIYKHRRWYWLHNKHRRHISGSRLSNSRWKVAKTQAKLACVYLAHVLQDRQVQIFCRGGGDKFKPPAARSQQTHRGLGGRPWCSGCTEKAVLALQAFSLPVRTTSSLSYLDGGVLGRVAQDPVPTLIQGQQQRHMAVSLDGDQPEGGKSLWQVWGWCNWQCYAWSGHSGQ